MSKVIEFANVTYSAGGRSVLRDFNLSVDEGETLVLLGRSGSGKTTALKLVNALLMPERGHVLVDGKSTAEWDLVRLRRRIGYVIQESGLFPHFTIRENVGLVPMLEKWEAPRIARPCRGVAHTGGPSGAGIWSAISSPALGRREAAHRRGSRARQRSAHPAVR